MVIKSRNSFMDSGWCWCYWSKDHCGYLWWLGSPWRWCLFWQRLYEGGPVSCIRSPLGGQVSCDSQALSPCSGSGIVCCACCFAQKRISFSNLPWIHIIQDTSRSSLGDSLGLKKGRPWCAWFKTTVMSKPISFLKLEIFI